MYIYFKLDIFIFKLDEGNTVFFQICVNLNTIYLNETVKS